MLIIDAAKLSVRELERLLTATEARGQHELAQSLRRELEARRMGVPSGGASPSSRAAEPAPIELEPRAAPMAGAPPRRVPLAGLLAAGFAVTALLAGVIVYTKLDPARAAPGPAPRPRAMALTTAPPTPPAGPALAVASAAPVTTPAAVTIRPTLAADGAALAPVRTAAANPAAKPKSNPCYDEANNAARLVCGYPSLSQMSRDLRSAYARALDAGADGESIQREQAEWVSAHADIADREALAEAYAARISELRATAEAAETLSAR